MTGSVKPLLMAALAGTLVLAMASAGSAQDLSPVSDMIGNLVTFVTGGFARGVATLALCGAAILLFVGRMNWPIFVGVFIGAVLLFSAGPIVSSI